MNWRAFLDAWKQRERVADHERRLQELSSKVADLERRWDTVIKQVRDVVKSVITQYRQDDR